MGALLNMKIIEKEFFSETEIIKILLQCLNGLAHLNKFNVSHRDIKPDNILLKNQENLEIMISDFGYSKIVFDD